MKPKIIFQGKSKQGRDIVIRYPNSGDAPKMCNYINTLSLEKTFITFQGEQQSLNDEKKYLKKLLEKIEKKKAVQLLVFCGDNLIGISDINLRDKESQGHVGLFGITIAKNFRSEGVGSILMKTVIEEAKRELPNLKIIVLDVFGNNLLARKIYKKFGFQEYGTLPQGINYRGKLVDDVSMFLKI